MGRPPSIDASTSVGAATGPANADVADAPVVEAPLIPAATSPSGGVARVVADVAEPSSTANMPITGTLCSSSMLFSLSMFLFSKYALFSTLSTAPVVSGAKLFSCDDRATTEFVDSLFADAPVPYGQIPALSNTVAVVGPPVEGDFCFCSFCH